MVIMQSNLPVKLGYPQKNVSKWVLKDPEAPQCLTKILEVFALWEGKSRGSVPWDEHATSILTLGKAMASKQSLAAVW